MNLIKKLILILLLASCLLGQAQATITRGQTATGTTAATNASSLALTVTAPDLTDGKYHYFAVAVAFNNAGLSMTADAGYSWLNIGNNTTTGTPTVALFWGRIFSGAGTTITVNSTNGAGPISAIVAEYKSDQPIRLDRAALNNGSSTSPSSGTTQTTSNANELCLAALCHRLQSASGTGTYTSPTNSYAEISAGGISTSNNTANADREVDLLEKFLTSTGTTSAGATVTTTGNWTGVVATFEEIAATPSRIPSIPSQ